MRKTMTIVMVAILSLVLSAPAIAQGGTIHIVQAGENLFRIALRYGTTVQALAAANGIANTSFVYSGQRLVIPGTGSTPSQSGSSSTIHVVAAGENLYRISLRYGVTLAAMASANGLASPYRIYVGQRLVVPGTGGSSTPANPPASGSSGRWIDVNLSAQTTTAYEGSTAVRTTLVSTGLPATPTPTGDFYIYVKYTSAPMSGPGYYLPNVPYVMYFYRGYGLHGTYWHSNFGHPMSHGCINLPTSEAQWFFNWASVGTLVRIHY